MDEAKPVIDQKPVDGNGGLIQTGIAVAITALLGIGAYTTKDDGSIKPTVETTLTAQAVDAHQAVIPAKRDSTGAVVEQAKTVTVPRVIDWPSICVPGRGHFVLDAGNYQPITVVITQGDVIIKKVVDVDKSLLQEAGNAMVDIQINTTPLNGTKTRGVESLKNEDF